MFFSYDDESKTSEMEIGEDMFVPNYGINFQILYNLFSDDEDYGLEVYYAASIGLKEKESYNRIIMYSFINHTIGLALRLEN